MVSFMVILGALAAAGGSIGYFVFPMGLRKGVQSQINLAEDGMVFPKYMDPPFGTKSKFYLFAIKNPREVLKGGRMSFELKGPYNYKTSLVRGKITFIEKGEKVAYDSGRKLVLDEENSANMDEKMWLVNPVLPSTARAVKTMVLDRVPFKRLTEPIVFNAVNLLLDTYGERLMMRLTPREILQGRKVQLLEAMTSLATRFGVASFLPPGPPQNTFGLAFVQNETIDSVEIYTGLGKTKNKFAEWSKFRGKDKMDIWRGECNSIAGTNGELYKPFLEEGKPIRIFLGPLCRSFTVDPVGDGPVLTEIGIRALEYEISPRLYLGARNNPNNKCFCQDARTYDCQYDGLIAMGPCFFDAPLFFSRANLKGVDPKIRDLVDWRSFVSGAPKGKDGKQLEPMPEKQSFKIEQITGSVLEANLTLVALFKVVRQPYMRDLANVQNLTYAPLFATNESIKVPFKEVWQIYFLQKLNDNYQMIMAGTAASGLGMLMLKLLFR